MPDCTFEIANIDKNTFQKPAMVLNIGKTFVVIPLKLIWKESLISLLIYFLDVTRRLKKSLKKL